MSPPHKRPKAYFSFEDSQMLMELYQEEAECLDNKQTNASKPQMKREVSKKFSLK